MSGGVTFTTLTQLVNEDVLPRVFPYIDQLDSNPTASAYAMHKGHSVELLRRDASKIRDNTYNNIRQKCMAWFYGFAAHLATDDLIHSVVILKVGPHEQKKTAHRRCEMSQDVYAYARQPKFERWHRAVCRMMKIGEASRWGCEGSVIEINGLE